MTTVQCPYCGGLMQSVVEMDAHFGNNGYVVGCYALTNECSQGLARLLAQLAFVLLDTKVSANNACDRLDALTATRTDADAPVTFT